MTNERIFAILKGLYGKREHTLSQEQGGQNGEISRFPDRRSPEARVDFERRKETMLALGEREGCLPHIVVLLKLAEAQAGFSDEGALFDYRARYQPDPKKSRIDRSRVGGRIENEDTYRLFQKYAESRSDWLRSLSVFIKAIQADETNPGLLMISDTRQKEWPAFSEWCQKHFLNPVTLLEVKKAIEQDSRVSWSALQSFPLPAIRRVLLESHQDRLMVEMSSNDDRDNFNTFIRLPSRGFDREPHERIRPAERSAMHDTFDYRFIVATYLEPKPQKKVKEVEKDEKKGSDVGASPKPKKEQKIEEFFAHGVHRISAEELHDLFSDLFTQFEDDSYQPLAYYPERGEVLRHVLWTLRGGEKAGFSPDRIDPVPATEGAAVDMFVEKGIMDWSMLDFHIKNKQFLEHAEALHHRSRGRIAKKSIQDFDLAQWYKKRLRTLGNITNRADAELREKELTIGLSMFCNPEVATDIEAHYPEEIRIGEDTFAIRYSWDGKGKHEAIIRFSARDDDARARRIVQCTEKDIPALGTNASPITVSFEAAPPQSLERPHRYFDGTEEKIEFPARVFSDVQQMVAYFDTARIAHAWKEKTRLSDFADNPKWLPSVFFELTPFDLSKKFPDAKAITQGKLDPVTVTRDGQPIFPRPVIAYNPHFKEFGVVLCSSDAVADAIERTAREMWEWKRKNAFGI